MRTKHNHNNHQQPALPRVKQEHLARGEEVEDLNHLEENTPATTMSIRAQSEVISITSTVTEMEGSTQTAPTSNSDIEMTDNDKSAPSAMQTMGQPARELIKAIQKLEALSIEATVPSLPKFVVIGDQSAGKSSLIEAACAITLPRSAGTCTRCPFQITTTAAKEGQPNWSCEVTLQIKYEPNDEARAGTDEQDFDGWAKMDTHEYQFARVNSKEDLEVVLRKAQLAILNPTTNPAIFANLSAHEAESRQQQGRSFDFSPNIISLKITGTELPELSLFDLPGAINATAIDDDQYLVEFIEALLTAYIRDEKAKILLACAANQDIETSTAFRYLHKYRALKRCMGVLTKPDLFESGATKIRQLEKMLQGDASTFKLGLGWYATKQLSQTQMEAGVAYDEARQREATFFASSHPWSDQLAAYTGRFGIPNLQKALSQLLTTDIIQSLPEILDRVKSRLADVDRELASFPEQAAAPSLTVITEIDILKTAIIKQINPNSAESSSRSEYQQAFRNLSDTLLANKPTVELKTPGYTKNSITLDDSDDEDMDDTPSKKIKTNGGRAVDSTPSRATPSSARMLHTNGSGRRRAVPDQASVPGRHRIEFKLEEIKARYDNAPGADMPGTTSEHVDRKLKLEPLDCWNLIVEQTLTQIKRLFTRVLKKTAEHALAKRKGSELYTQAITLTRELFEELHDKQTGFAYQLVAAHNHRPITYSKTIWRAKVSAVENALRTKRLEQRVDEHFDTLESQGYKVPSKPDQKRKAADPAWVTSTLGVDEYEREVKALAQPIAYYEHAAAQLVDVLARMCEQGLMGQYESRIHRHLFEGLGATDQDHCARLLAEDPAREEQRHKLKAEKAKLEQALADLEELPVLHG